MLSKCALVLVAKCNKLDYNKVHSTQLWSSTMGGNIEQRFNMKWGYGKWFDLEGDGVTLRRFCCQHSYFPYLFKIFKVTKGFVIT